MAGSLRYFFSLVKDVSFILFDIIVKWYLLQKSNTTIDTASGFDWMGQGQFSLPHGFLFPVTFTIHNCQSICRRSTKCLRFCLVVNARCCTSFTDFSMTFILFAAFIYLFIYFLTLTSDLAIISSPSQPQSFVCLTLCNGSIPTLQYLD